MGKYDDLKKRYSEYVSKDQLYTICKMSKRSAKYLLDNGIIPCIDNGKKTCRYRIAINDIIAYLERRDVTGDTQIPYGAVSSRSNGLRVSYSQITQVITLALENEVRQYFEYIFTDFPDVLTTYDLTEMTGLCSKSVLQLLKQGEIKSLHIGNERRIPKEYVLEFVSSKRFLNLRSNSPDFIRILGGFERWQRAKSSL